MDPQEEGVTHPAMRLEVVSRGVQRIPEEVLLAAGRSRADDQRETQMRLGEVIPQAGNIRIKEDLSPTIRTEGNSRASING